MPFQQPELLNKRLRDENEEAVVILFKETDGEPVFVQLFTAPWRAVRDEIVATLSVRDEAPSILSIKPVGSNESYENLYSFFNVDSIDFAMKFNAFFVNSQSECKNLILLI